VGKLVHFQADGSPVELKLDRQRITIGRRPDNDLCLPYPAVSGEHAVVLTILDDSFLEDLRSTNGTLVNGAAVAKYFLRDRDEIDVGRHILIYCADDGAKVERPQTQVDGESRGKRRMGSVPRPARALEPVAPDVYPTDASSDVEATVEFSPTPESRGPARNEGATNRALEQPPYQFLDGEPVLRVISGVKAGRIVALVKEETLIGRLGVQVVALRKMQHEVHVVPVEGGTPLSVNGARVAAEGMSLALGDVLEIAGSKLELIVPVKRSSA